MGYVTGSGPAVLLLHGGPGMTDYMQSLLPELDGYRAALFQQRGVAPSTLAAPFDVPTLRDDVIDVLDTLGWEAPAMIGHSWGGHLLLHLLAVTPTRVGAALAVDPLGAVGDGGVAAFEAELLRRLPEATVARLKELEGVEATRALTPGRAPRGHGDRLAGILLQPGGGATHPPDRSRPERRELGLNPRRATGPR